MITAGYVYVAMPPLYRLKWTKGPHDFNPGHALARGLDVRQHDGQEVLFTDAAGNLGLVALGGVIDLEDTGLGCVLHRRIDVVAGVDRHGGNAPGN